MSAFPRPRGDVAEQDTEQKAPHEPFRPPTARPAGGRLRFFVAADPWLYKVARVLVRPTVAPFFRFEVSGEERLPLTGPALLAVNHQSDIDPLFVGLAAGATAALHDGGREVRSSCAAARDLASRLLSHRAR